MAKSQSRMLRKDSSALQIFVISVLILSSILAAYIVRIRPVTRGQPIDLEESLVKGILTLQGTDRPAVAIRQSYTGIEGLDVVFRTLVSAFIAGPGRLEQRVWLQQFHFLLGFAPMMGIQVIESSRDCWKKCWAIRFTWTWGILYQTIAGALALPWYLASFIWASRRSQLTSSATKSYLTANQALTVPSAKAALSTIILGYVAPTVAMYLYPFHDDNTLMAVIAYWMITPAILDLFIMVLQPAYAAISPAKAETRPDATYLYTMYAYLAAIAGLAHVYTIYALHTSPDPWSLFMTAFVPSNADAALSTIAGFHHIFQWDWVFVASFQVLWAMYGLWELKVAGLTSVSPILSGLLVLLATILLGPGGSLALAWWWRETKLVEHTRLLATKKE